MQTLSDQTGLDLYNNSVNNAYLQFGQKPTNSNALAVYDTSLQSLNSAVAQQQAGTISLTDSQLGAINTQAEAVHGRVNELGAYGRYIGMLDQVHAAKESGMTAREFAQRQGIASTLTDAEASLGLRNQAGVAEHAMADAISALLKLPTNAQNQAKVEAARQAYFDYLTASPENKAAAYDNTVNQLRESINAALEMDGLDAGSRAALEGMLEEIDSGKRLGDNRGSGNHRNRNDYRETFFNVNPELRGKVAVHHGIEQQVLRRPETAGLFTEEEIHAYENLRGIPNEINSELHLSQIRKEWNRFYKENLNPTREQVMEKRLEIDRTYGLLFNPRVF